MPPQHTAAFKSPQATSPLGGKNHHYQPLGLSPVDDGTVPAVFSLRGGFQIVDPADTIMLRVLALAEVRRGSLTVGHISHHKSAQNPRRLKSTAHPSFRSFV